jgi:predicted RNA-binding protein with PIN domain
MAQGPARRGAGRAALTGPPGRAVDGTLQVVRWLIDGNNVYGSRPDGWWNDRSAAARRFTQRVAEWCRTHDDEVVIVFDPPVDGSTSELAGGNLSIEPAPRHGRNAADDHIIELVDQAIEGADITVVTSDRGLRQRLPRTVEVMGVGHFRDLIGY